MPDEQQILLSDAKIRRFILSCLGYNAGGLNQTEILDRFSCWCRTIFDFAPDLDLTCRVLCELRAMRVGGGIVLRRINNKFVHQQTTHGWLAWTRARQEEDAAQAPARL